MTFPSGRGPRALAAPIAGVGAWGGLVAVASIWGLDVVHRHPAARIFAPPLVATWHPGAEAWVAIAIALGIAALVWGPRFADGASWRRLLAVAFVAAAAWAAAVSVAEGTDGPVRPLRQPNDYIRDVPAVDAPVAFLEGFTRDIARYQQHVRAHPPGFVLLLAGLDAIGLGGVGWEAALVILGGAAAVPAVLVSLREVAGERPARAAAPFLVFAPAAVYVASTADAFFAGVTAWGVAGVILATGRSDRRGDGLALAGGIGLGMAVFLSYGMVLLAAIPIAVAIARRRLRPLLVAAAGVVVVAVAFGLAGFWWAAGLAATAREYRASVARFRPYGYFVVGNLAAFAITLGPAGGAGLAALRDRRVWLLVGAALAGIAIADLSGMSKGEVERIWLPFVPWVLVATSALGSGDTSGRAARPWLGLNLVATLLLETLLHNTW